MAALPLSFARWFSGLAVILVSVSPGSVVLAAEPPKEHAAFTELFKQHGATGTVVVLDLRTDSIAVHDSARAARRFIPASTFKIPNSLIALESGAVKSVDEVLPYGGKKQFLPEWEYDLPLREAYKRSSVPIYKEVARRVGLERMKEWVKRFDYGNHEVGTVVDQFWLEGPLEISALEQARFLARMIRGELPVKPSTLQTVKEITRQESWQNGALHAKTGWCMSTDPDVGWWVGWIEQDGVAIATFALNLDVRDKADAAKRIPLGRACLQERGLLKP